MIRQGCYGLSFGLAFAARVVKAVVQPSIQSKRAVAVPAKVNLSTPDRKLESGIVKQRHVNTSLVSPLKHLVLSAIKLLQNSLRNFFNPFIRLRAIEKIRDWIASAQTKLKTLSKEGGGIFQYAIVTAAYWAFTVTDGAIRMMVLFQFHLLGYSAFQIAALFLFYEIFGVVTNFVGGWIASRMGLKFTLFGGTAIQIVALLMLAVISPSWSVGFLVTYTMISQALSGIAKDLTKMSSKSAIKSVVPKDADPALYRWVSLLTGSKNALKGVGFFVGAFLLTIAGFSGSAFILAVGLTAILCLLPKYLPNEIGKAKTGTKLTSMFALDARINILSAARFFLFGARDVWFVVALPVYMTTVLGWSPMLVGAYLALWTIGYGIVQALAPRFVSAKNGATPNGYNVMFWAAVLAAVPAAIAAALAVGFPATASITIGLAIFGVIFAINSAVHSYMIVHYADSEKVAMTIGFYYMANAGGRLAGTVLSGGVYLVTGIQGCLWVSALLLVIAAIVSARLPHAGNVRISNTEKNSALLPAPEVLQIAHVPSFA